MIRVSFQGSCEVQNDSCSPFRFENQPLGGMSFPFSDGYLKILSSGTYFPDEPLGVSLSFTPTFLAPTSNDDLSHPRKIFCYKHVPVCPYNQSRRNPAWYVTQRIRNIPPELQWQIDPAPSGAHKCGITGDSYRSSNTPSRLCGTSSEGRMT